MGREHDLQSTLVLHLGGRQRMKQGPEGLGSLKDTLMTQVLQERFPITSLSLHTYS